MLSIEDLKTAKEVEDFVNDHLGDHHREIGRIASVWAMFEFRMDQLIWYLMSVEQALGACVTTQMMGPAPRMRAIKMLLKMRQTSEPIIKKIDKLHRKLYDNQEERNRSVHDAWFVGNVSKTVPQMRLHSRHDELVYELREVPISELQKIYDDSVKKLLEFNALQTEIRSELEHQSIDSIKDSFFRTSLAGEKLFLTRRRSSKSGSPSTDQ